METMIDTTAFEKRLRDEKAALEKQLAEIAVRNPEVRGDWELREPSLLIAQSDQSEAADRLEELEENNALLSSLEDRLHEVDAALARIKEGTYGICELSGKPIEEDRLDANPCARTCKEHLSGMSV